MPKKFSTNRKSGHPRQNKALGQVFLKDEWPCTRMTDKLIENGVTEVLEIGPGAAALTKHLVRAGLKVTCVEKDTRFAELLNERKDEIIDGSSGTLDIINKDFLKFDLEEWISSKSDSVAVCGNIPYNISSPILSKVLPLIHKMKLASFLVQLEFGERVCSSAGNKNYGSLSVFSQLRARTNLDFVVSKKCFSPVPKVDSAVVSFQKPLKTYDLELLKKVETVTRQSFTMRRKKLHNAMAKFLNGVDLEGAPVDLSKRPDVTTPEEYVAMTKFIFRDED